MKKISIQVSLGLLFVIALLFNLGLYGQTTSVSNGDWNNTGTWSSGSIPNGSVAVIIAHNVTLNQDATVNSLTINSGGSFIGSDATARTLTINSGGSFTNNGAFDSGIGLINFSGTGTITGTIGFNNVTIYGNVSFGTASTINGILKLTGNGAITSPSTPPFYAVGSTLLYDKSTSHSRNLEWSALSGAGYPYNVTLSGGVALNIGANSGTAVARSCAGVLNVNAFCKLNMTTGGTMTKPVTVYGDVMNAGTITLSTNSGGALKIYGNLNNTGSIVTNSSSVFFEGSTATTLSSSTSIVSISINKSSGNVRSVSIELTVNNLSVTSGSLEIPVGASLTATASVTNVVGADGIVLKSNASGTGSFSSPTAVNATVERYIGAWGTATEGWHFLSSPVESQAISPAFTVTPADEYDFYAYNETEETDYEYWLNFKAGDFAGWNGGENFVPGRGYLVSYKTNDTKLFKGLLNVSDVTIPLTYTLGNEHFGWNLVGNPFASGLLWGGSDWSEDIYDVAKCLSSVDESYIDVNPYDVIPINNGFLVCTTVATDLIIPALARTSGGTWYKKCESVNKINLSANERYGTSAQSSNIRIVPEATTDFDRKYDSEFVPFYAPQFYSQIADFNLSTNSIPEINENTIIPFGFVKNSSSDFTIQLKESIEGYTIYLKDLKSNTDHNLSADSVYAFTSFEGDDPNRFLLHFKQTTGVSDEADDQKLEFVYANGALYLSGLETDAEIRVTNMLGQVVLSRFATGNDVQELNTSGLSKGVYILSVLTGSQKKSGKFVVR